jgi:hypothetical protein
MLRAFVDWVRPPPVRTAAALHELLERQAARLTTQSTVNFCRVKASANAKKLFSEKVFRSGLHACRWEAYAVILADAARVAEAYLRPCAGERIEEIAERLADFHARCLAVEPRPHGGDWAEATQELRHSLARARMAEPLMAHDIAVVSGNRVFDLLPIHKSLRREDREVIVNQIRFGFASLRQELDRRGDPGAIVADYLRAGG